jgi:hypothetical protein
MGGGRGYIALVVWILVFFFGWLLDPQLTPFLSSFGSLGPRPVTQKADLYGDALERIMAGVVKRTPFQGLCKQPGMIFQFTVNGEIETLTNGEWRASATAPKGQTVFVQYEYTPPDSVSFDLMDWANAGRPVGPFSFSATGEYEVEVEIYNSADDTAVSETGTHEVSLICDVEVPPSLG